MPKPLLQGFIESKLETYREPTREGTPRGESIGFPRNKYLSTLLHLTSMPLKDIAKEAGVSYGLLRKWRTEKAFRKAVQAHDDEFVALFLDHLRRKAESMYNQWVKVTGKSVEQTISLIMSIHEDERAFRQEGVLANPSSYSLQFMGLTEFEDADRYNPVLLLAIADKFQSTEVEKHLEPFFVVQATLVIDFIYTQLRKKQKFVVDSEELFSIKVIKRVLEKAHKALSQPELSEKDRFATVHLLNIAINML